MRKNILLLSFIFIVAPFNIFGQRRGITRQEYYSVINSAVDKRFKLSRREKTTTTIYSKATVKEVEVVTDDYQLPNKRRYLQILTVGGKVQKLELIKIENSYFQKKDNRKWTKEKQWNLPLF